MTKMHMEWAARHVKLDTDAEYRAVLAVHFAAMFSHFNPRFDRSRFMAACGLDPNT